MEFVLSKPHGNSCRMERISLKMKVLYLFVLASRKVHIMRWAIVIVWWYESSPGPHANYQPPCMELGEDL